MASGRRDLGARDPALIFGEIASSYSRHRPGYPPELYDDLLELAGPVRRALEVGAGTGKATIELARRGIEVVALEPDPAMAAVAMRECDKLPVQVHECRLEDWSGDDGSFDLIVSAQSWHWVDRSRGPAVARRALKENGVLAIWWNQAAQLPDPIRGVLDAIYMRHAPELSGSIVNRRVHNLEAGAFEPAFGQREIRSYRWIERYDSATYCEMLQTHSDHRLLPRKRLERLTAAVSATIDEFANGEIAYPYQTDLYVFRRV